MKCLLLQLAIYCRLTKGRIAKANFSMTDDVEISILLSLYNLSDALSMLVHTVISGVPKRVEVPVPDRGVRGCLNA